MEQFKTVEKWFSAQALAASSDPYQDVCDNYQDFIRLLKTYTENKNKNKKITLSCFSKEDKMKEVLEKIIGLLRGGFAACSTWHDHDGVRHFCYVNNQIALYKQQLIDDGYKFDS